MPCGGSTTFTPRLQSGKVFEKVTVQISNYSLWAESGARQAKRRRRERSILAVSIAFDRSDQKNSRDLLSSVPCHRGRESKIAVKRRLRRPAASPTTCLPPPLWCRARAAPAARMLLGAGRRIAACGRFFQYAAAAGSCSSPPTAFWTQSQTEGANLHAAVNTTQLWRIGQKPMAESRDLERWCGGLHQSTWVFQAQAIR